MKQINKTKHVVCAHTGSVKWTRGNDISASSITMQLEGIGNIDEAHKAIADGSDDEWAVDMGEEVEEALEEEDEDEDEDEPSEPAVETIKMKIRQWTKPKK